MRHTPSHSAKTPHYIALPNDKGEREKSPDPMDSDDYVKWAGVPPWIEAKAPNRGATT